jgi:hypothetical protein
MFRGLSEIKLVLNLKALRYSFPYESFINSSSSARKENMMQVFW